MFETEQGLRAHFQYATDLFDGSTIERLAGHFRTLLEGIATARHASISELPLLSECERRQLLDEWNDTAAIYPLKKCVHELFAEQARGTPEKVAVVYEDREITYGELDRRSSQLAHHLRELGVGPEVVVGLCVERSPEILIGLFGILKAGGTYLPLDPSYPQMRLGYMLTDARASVLVTQASLRGHLLEDNARIVQIDADWSEIERHPVTAPRSTVLPGNAAYVIYTSGSTGKPKGVMVSHVSVANLLHAMAARLDIESSDVLISVTPISFDIAGLELYLPLVLGGRVVLISRSAATDATKLLAELSKNSGTVLQATPATWQMLVDTGWSPGSDLKILCGGEALSKELAKTLVSGGSDVWNLYGPTETTIWSTASQLKQAESIAIGRPIANTRVYVLDRDFCLVPVGVRGELYIGGIGLARGYLGRADLTAERFVPSPFGDGERLYRTGDLARWRSDGELEYLGRIDNQVKVRGFRIELGEIEEALRSHAKVQNAFVVVYEEKPGEKRLVAYAVSQQASHAVLEAGELRAYLKKSLPEYMVPSAFIVLGELPLTPNGKIDHRGLPKPEEREEISMYEAPSLPIEEALTRIWAEVLKLDRVGIHDNFFELGGHSLLGIQVIARVRDVLEVELPLRALFETPTVSELAAQVAELERTTTRGPEKSRSHYRV